MKVLLVTSEVTFVPNNYNDLILGIADHEDIVGVVELRNKSWKLFFKAIVIFPFMARNIGYQLLKNILGFSSSKRKNEYQKRNKFFLKMNTVNCEQMITLIRSQQIDLIVNARTRNIYKNKILESPKIGCINIHHGLLPEQRGTMCDLWALSEGTETGFTIHQMNTRIDDGGIITVHKITPSSKNYMDYLAYSTKKEKEVLAKALSDINNNGIQCKPNICDKSKIVYRKNPNSDELITIKNTGVVV